MAARSREVYRALIYEDEDFLRFFEQITPISELGRLNIGSRPPSRAGTSAGVEALRAIPWVFAWTQNRVLLPSWYGAGTAFAEADLDVLREMNAEWPFFASVVSTLEMALFKTDLGVAAGYLRLVDPDCATACGSRSPTSWRAAAIAASSRSRASRGCSPPRRRCSSASRTATRGSTPSTTSRSSCSPAYAPGAEQDREALLATISGIAAGLRNTG